MLRNSSRGILGVTLILLPIVFAGCCVYNGVKYSKGDVVEDGCAIISCEDDQWVFSGYSSNCKICSIRNDPHITTFDTYHYDWHDTCNYSISQPGFGYKAKFGIYGQFQSCGSASCVHLTTFKDNPFTVIEIDHSQGPYVSVNGNPYTVQSYIEGLPTNNPSQPILAWTDGNCNTFMGSQGFLLQTCSDQMFLWAHRKLSSKLYGLCGRYNYVVKDDFTLRDGSQEQLTYNPAKFPLSWLTADQPNDRCKKEAVNPCNADEDERKELYERCEMLLKEVIKVESLALMELVKINIQDCVIDICNLRENGADENEIAEWERIMQKMLIEQLNIEANAYTKE